MQDRFDNPAVFHIGDGTLDLGEPVVAHEPVDGKSSLLIQLDQVRHELACFGVALDGAADGPAVRGTVRACPP